MILNGFSKIYDSLPLHAEEGGFCTTISRKDLLHAVTDTGDAAAAETQLQIIERLFDSLSLLDSEQLAQGQWRFVSFSASLLARSLLETLADSDSRLLERHFWLSDQPDHVITEQRQILHELEIKRVCLHRHQCAKPIRYVHVAWAFIKLEGRFLLHHREDKHRPDIANYVPIGGKLHLCDLGESFSQAEALALLQSPAQADIFKALSVTLQREVAEETGLHFSEHYQFSKWLTLKPYRKVEGAGSRHSYTEYQIIIYQLQLTRPGFFALMRSLHESTALAFFTPAELARGFKSDGKTAFIDALQTEYNEDQAVLTSVLNSISESYTDNDATNLVTQPATLPMGNPLLLVGTTGNERELPIEWDDEQCRLLFALGWHRRSLPITLRENVQAYLFGWLTINNEDTCLQLLNMSDHLAGLGLPLIECVDEHVFRLNLAAGNVFFADSFFSVRFIQARNRVGIELCNESVETPIGWLDASILFIPLSPKLTRELNQVATVHVYQVENPNLPGLVRREIEKLTMLKGLRKLMRQDNGVYFLTINNCETNFLG
jgi:8-oxo-dGTP pyrophosphatase MutT (NUDIX family)